jgi:exopolysaccharide production protein ExoQ
MHSDHRASPPPHASRPAGAADRSAAVTVWSEQAKSDAPTDAERIFVVLSLAYFAKAFGPFIGGFEVGGYAMQAAAYGNPLDQTVGGAIYVISVALLLREHSVVRAIVASPLLSAFIVLTIVSALWSAVPGVTLRRAVGLLGTASFGAYLACRFSPHEVLRAIAAALAIATAMSILLIVFVPSYGTADGREIAGVFGQKNELGRAMVFTVLATWAVIRDPESDRPIWAIPTLIAALVLLFLSRSAQALVGLAAGALVAIPLLTLCARFFRRVNLKLGLSLLIATGILAFFVSAVAEELLEMLGRDATLTDRTLIWDLLIEFARERPWLGRGYGAFWFSDVSVWFAERWGALDHAHNGYMDLWLELGYVGVIGLLLVLLSASKTAWDAYLMRPTASRRFFPAFILIAALVNCVGRLIPAHNSIYWVILCYCAVMHLSLQRSNRAVSMHYRNRPLQVDRRHAIGTERPGRTNDGEARG